MYPLETRELAVEAVAAGFSLTEEPSWPAAAARPL